MLVCRNMYGILGILGQGWAVGIHSTKKLLILIRRCILNWMLDFTSSLLELWYNTTWLKRLHIGINLHILPCYIPVSACLNENMQVDILNILDTKIIVFLMRLLSFVFCMDGRDSRFITFNFRLFIRVTVKNAFVFLIGLLLLISGNQPRQLS